MWRPYRWPIVVAVVASMAVGWGQDGGLAAARPGGVVAGSEPTSVVVLTVETHLRSSTGKRLAVDLVATRNGYVQIELANGRGESHTWTFQDDIVGYRFRGELRKGRGSVVIPAGFFGPYGTFHVRFRPVSKPTTTECGSAKTWRESVSGHFYFATHAGGRHSWGHFGRKRDGGLSKAKGWFTDPVGSPQCGTSRPPCLTGVTWSGTNDLSGGDQIVDGRRHGAIDAAKQISLRDPGEAERLDVVLLRVKPPMVHKLGSHATLTIRTSGPGASGGGTVHSNVQPEDESRSCGHGGYEKATTWAGNLKTHGGPIVIREQIEGNFRISQENIQFTRSRKTS